MPGIHMKKMKEAILIKEAPIWHMHKRPADKVRALSCQEGPQACCRFPISSLRMDLHPLLQLCFLLYKIPKCTWTPTSSSTPLAWRLPIPNQINKMLTKEKQKTLSPGTKQPGLSLQSKIIKTSKPKASNPEPRQPLHRAHPLHLWTVLYRRNWRMLLSWWIRKKNLICSTTTNVWLYPKVFPVFTRH